MGLLRGGSVQGASTQAQWQSGRNGCAGGPRGTTLLSPGQANVSKLTFALILTQDALVTTPAHTLRTHPDPIRRISTLEAVARLLLDMGEPQSCAGALLASLRVADAAYHAQVRRPCCLSHPSLKLAPLQR